MSEPQTSTPAIAAALAARITHDVAGHVSGVISGLELCAEAGDETLREEGLKLAAASAQSLQDLLAFCRVAFTGAGEPQSAQALAKLAQTPFDGRRAELTWSATVDEFSPLAAQAVLILAQIAAAGLSRGGTATLSAIRSDRDLVIRIDGEGPRIALQPEALEGLAGEPLSSGLAGRWAPAVLINQALAAAGGQVTAAAGTLSFILQARVPIPAP